MEFPPSAADDGRTPIYRGPRTTKGGVAWDFATATPSRNIGRPSSFACETAYKLALVSLRRLQHLDRRVR